MKSIQYSLIGILLICIAIPMAAIEGSSYKNLTDRDRIMLAISYFEVAQQYRIVKKIKLANGYHKEAIKIEPEVEEYASGEKKLPPKKITFDWDAIFEESTEIEKDDTTTTTTTIETAQISDSDESTHENVVESDDKAIGALVESLISALLVKDSASAAALFDEYILIEANDIKLLRVELQATMEQWINTTRIDSLEYNIQYDKQGDRAYQVAITFIDLDSFFVPLEDNTLLLTAEMIGDRYMFTTILAYQDSDSSDAGINNATSDNPEHVILDVIQYLLANDIDSAVSYFNRDVWFDEYQMLVSIDSLKTHLQEWKETNSDLSEIGDVVNTASISLLQENDSTLFENWQIELDDFYKISMRFNSTPIFPGVDYKSHYVVIIEEFTNPSSFQIVAVAQFN